MLEKQNAATPIPSPDVGRVIFLPETKQDFLFFIPSKVTPALKLLEGSMWFKIININLGHIYRSATSLEALYWLRDNLGQLSLSPEVNLWRKNSSIIKPIQPIENLPLFDFQRDAVGFLARRPRAMLSLSPGLGKTISSITAANKLFPKIKNILVVAPLSLLYMWKSEIEKWGSHFPTHQVIIHHGKKSSLDEMSKKAGQTTWVITNPETAIRAVPTLLSKKFDLLILDESILYKSRDSQRTKGIKKLAKGIPYVWELTGAPANRMIDDIWSQFNILDPKAYSSYWRFAQEYCMVNPTTWGNQVIANKRDAEQKIKERFQDIYFARSQSEVLDIPEWIFEEIDVVMTKRQEKAYHEMSTQLKTTLTNEDTGDKTIVTVTNHLSKVIRLIQLSSNPMLLDGDNESGKWAALPELMEIYPGPFLVWTSFTRTAYYLAEYLGRMVNQQVGMIIGDTKAEDRETLIKRFQSGSEKILILNMQTGSFGHTLTAARTAFYPERNYDSNYFQSLHRFRRIGTTQSPNVVHLRSVYQDGSPTIDHLVHSLLDYRVGMIQDLTTGMLKEILK
jgi:SNF2 family DNA or RNA helicase